MLLQKFRQHFLVKNKIKPLERFTKDVQWTGNFNSPQAYYDYYFVEKDTGIVGTISGGMSPLHDTFYLCKLEVPLKHQRNDYELSMLVNIAQFYGVPITPMPEIDHKILMRLQNTVNDHFKLNAQISVGKMDAEILKWNHLSVP